MTKVLVCGGRDFDDWSFVRDKLDDIDYKCYITGIIHGGATGADSLAGKWAALRDVPVLVFHADWTHGRKAGPIRNRRMIRESNPDLVVAFPGGRGTADMIRRAKESKIRVIEAV